MKLIHKITGEVWDIWKILTNDYPSYDTLEQIAEDFEDYRKPLIKDEKTRRAVRAWAEANNLMLFMVAEYKGDAGFNEDWFVINGIDKINDCKWSVEFIGKLDGFDSNEDNHFLIEDLCGEES